MNICITGGAGFIGSQLGLHLARLGHNLRLIDNFSSGTIGNVIFDGQLIGEVNVVDVRDKQLDSHLEKCEVLIHLAGIASLPSCESDPLEAFDVNTSGTANVLSACRRVGVSRVIFSSTSAVYETNSKLPSSESDVVNPNLVYSQSKWAAERICLAAASNYGQDVAICRFFNVFGPHQDVLRKSPPFTSYVARELIKGRQPQLFNNSNSGRDYIFIDDAIDLLSRMVTHPQTHDGEIYNIGSGQTFTVPNLYRIFQELLETSIEPLWGSPEEIWKSYPNLESLSKERIALEVHKSSCADMSKVQGIFDWTPQTPIENGLQRVIEHSRYLDQRGCLF